MSLSFAHMNWEVHLWAKIIYACLVHDTHLTEVTRDRVCLIYALMWDNIDLNVNAIIFFCNEKSLIFGGS